MPYSTTPITSGAAKFSTLDPDAPLFLQENNITRGADPENPITFYNQQTGELNAVNSIITSGSELNINSSDLIGVKRFMCHDYLGALKTVASNTIQKALRLDDISGANAIVYTTKLFRIPSNLVSGSVVRVRYYAGSVGSARNNGIYMYNPNTDARTIISTHSTPGGTDEYVEYDLSVNAGQLFGFWCQYSGARVYCGSYDVSIKYDSNIITGSIWDVIN